MITAFEAEVLSAVRELERTEGRASGMTLRRLLDERLNKIHSVGIIYAVTDRLEEDKGFLRSWLGKPTAARGWRPPKFWILTQVGGNALTEYEARQNGQATIPVWLLGRPVGA